MASLAWYVLLCVIWGSTWLVIKVGYGGLGPFNVAALRFLIAGVMLAVMIPALDARWPRARHEWLLICWIGVVLFGADYGLIYWGEQYLDSGLTAILFATLPLITVGFAHVYIPGDRITPRKLAGTLLAFFGVVACLVRACGSISAALDRWRPSSPRPCARPPLVWPASGMAQPCMRRRSTRRRCSSAASCSASPRSCLVKGCACPPTSQRGRRSAIWPSPAAW